MKEVTVILSSTWKFAATFPAAIYIFNMSVMQTLIYTNLGGLVGIILSSLFSRSLLTIASRLRNGKITAGRKKIFSRRSRRIIRIKTTYGLTGIILLTPVILSIPVGVFLIERYYRKTVRCHLLLFTGLVSWSVIYTVLYNSLGELLSPYFV